MAKSIFEIQTCEGALRWMLHRNMILKKTTKDPETYATVQGFILSDELRDLIGSNLVKLIAKAANGSSRAGSVSIRDAFLAATMAAVLEMGYIRLRDDEMAQCASIAFALLPIGRLEGAGLANRSLRTFSRSRASVEKLQNLLGLRSYLTL
jgi:hypothetical protein